MSALKRLAMHLSLYSGANLMNAIAGVITFPILTRLFSVADYGVMSLIGVTLTLLVGVGKFGLQHATIRFYGEIEAGKRPESIDNLYSTALLGVLATSTTVTMLWAVAVPWLPPQSWYDTRLPRLLLVTAVLIAIRAVDSILLNLLRAQERTRAVNVYGVLRRYAGAAVLLLVLFEVAGNLWGFYGATIATELVAVVALAAWSLRHIRCRWTLFSPPLFRALLLFGLPMIGFELSGATLALGNRFVIELTVGAAGLGIYSATYNLCEYIQGIVLSAVSQSVQPMYVRIWENEGREETVAFLRRFLHFYLMLALPSVAGLTAIGDELLPWLASAKYANGAVLIPWIVGGMIFDSAMTIFGAGLYLEKRTRTVMILMASCAVLNLGLNVLLVPRLNILGAAVASLASYSALAGAMMFAGRRLLGWPFPLASLFKFAALSVAMYLVVIEVRFGNDIATLLARVATGGFLYLCLILAFDKDARRLFASLRSRLVSVHTSANRASP
jgi:O-antigen/teichoic acid export membrane protein